MPNSSEASVKDSIRESARLPTHETGGSDGGRPADWDDRYASPLVPVDNFEGEYRVFLGMSR